MGSDNPSGQYRRVQCPEVLNKLSGCSRSDDHCFPKLDYAVPTERMPYVGSDGKPLPESAYGTGGTGGGTTPPSTGTTPTTSTKPPSGTTSSSTAGPTTKSTTLSPVGDVDCYSDVSYYPLSPLYCTAQKVGLIVLSHIQQHKRVELVYLSPQ